MSCFGFRPRARKTTDNLGSETLRPRLVPLRTVSNNHDFDTVLPLTESSLQAQSAISLNSENISEDLEKLLNKAEKAMVKSFLPTHAQVTWYGLCNATSQAVSDVHARLAIQHLEYLFEIKEPVRDCNYLSGHLSIDIQSYTQVTSKATDYEAGVIIATAFQAKRIFKVRFPFAIFALHTLTRPRKSMSELLPWFINYQVGLVFSKLASSPNLSGKRTQVIVDWRKELLPEVRDFAKRQDYSDTSVYQVQCVETIGILSQRKQRMISILLLSIRVKLT